MKLYIHVHTFDNIKAFNGFFVTNKICNEEENLTVNTYDENIKCDYFNIIISLQTNFSFLL